MEWGTSVFKTERPNFFKFLFLLYFFKGKNFGVECILKRVHRSCFRCKCCVLFEESKKFLSNMAEIRLTRVEQGQTKIRNVPIAVTPEGFWCCPSPVVFQKTLKSQNTLNKPKPSSSPPKTTAQKKHIPLTDRKTTFTPSRSGVISDGQRSFHTETTDGPALSAPVVTERAPKPKVDTLPRKVAIEFGEPGTSDMKVILIGKQGFCVKLSVHKNVLIKHSSFFADKLSDQQSSLSCLEIDDCEDVEIYVETVGLMYCKEMKQRLIKQSVSRVLRILKVNNATF